MKSQHRLIRTALVTCALALATSVTAALAGPPVLPSSFFGLVKTGSANVSAGTSITAWISGTLCGATTVIVYESDSVYSLDVPADNPDTAAKDGGVAGDRITFRVGNERIVHTADWVSGTHIRIDLMQYRVFAPIVRRGL